MQYASIYMNTKQIGDRIRYYRHKKGLTQQNLADKVGVTWEMISRYERGESSAMGQIERISAVLDMSPTEFIAAGYSQSNNLVNNSAILPYFNNSQKLKSISKVTEFEKLMKDSFNYYNAPTWILAKFPESFAIEAGAIKSNTITTKDKGVWYFSRYNKSMTVALNDMVVLHISKQGLAIDVFNKTISQDTVLAFLIAQEERFV
jgi:transcriptional regulator with XRE-family HTH domain